MRKPMPPSTGIQGGGQQVGEVVVPVVVGGPGAAMVIAEPPIKNVNASIALNFLIAKDVKIQKNAKTPTRWY